VHIREGLAADISIGANDSCIFGRDATRTD
jgi:hypothetical protein